MFPALYTIGYAGFPFAEFAGLLKQHGICGLVDVRSNPNSTYHPDYNRDILAQRLKEAGIRYRNYAKEFGARQPDRQYYPEGYLDFALFSQSAPFLEGVERLCAAMQAGYTFTLMCAESDPIDCHRAILVSRAFARRGVEVCHLMTKQRTLSQQQLENRLVEHYFPDWQQCSLLAPQQPYEVLVEQAYQKRNAEIGYRLQEDAT